MNFRRSRPVHYTEADPRTFIVVDRLERVAEQMERLATEMETRLRLRAATEAHQKGEDYAGP